MVPGDLTKYEPVIGLEVHVRLNLNTKLFCDDPFQYGESPNTLIGPISLAYPGSLPKVNKKAIEYAIKIGIACGSEIANKIIFDRKNYFFPDLPKGYQLTQDRLPVCKGGTIRIGTNSGIRQIALTKIHLEEDAGKSIHDGSEDFTQIDFNRAGTALIEIVTDPVLSSPEEAYSFMFEVRRLVRALGIGDGNMEQGSLRCDANISLRKQGDHTLGTKVEIKNVNSFNNVKKALLTEITRQNNLLEEGENIISESRTFDPISGKTFGMRTKETLTDYRYFPDPDLTPIIVDKSWHHDIKAEISELPMDRQLRYIETLKLPENIAVILTDSTEISQYFEQVADFSGNPKSSANWVIGPVKSALNSRGIPISDFQVTPQQMGTIIKWVDSGALTQNIAVKQLFPSILSYPEESLESLFSKLNERIDVDQDLEAIVEGVLKSLPEEAELLRNGKNRLLGMFMGKIMKASNGGADPKKAKNILLRLVNNK